LPGNFVAFRSRQGEAIFVWCRRFGDIAVNRNSSPLSLKWAVILLAAAVLALAGCGRKGPLDLPPTGTHPTGTQPTGTQPSAAAPADTDTDTEQASKPTVFNSGYGGDGTLAPKGVKRPFILDPLLGN
jgi:predicted small lipoprotein YifL